ncbi:MAG: lactonase family protein [Lutibacter sp.]|nr:lactonase family protein [Lutibacter sp.]MDP3945074.1 lactonase family protein [Lutibacter sp.]
MKSSLLLVLFFYFSMASAQNIPLYVGTYTDADSEGIYLYDFNLKTGELTNKKLAVEAVNPSYITFSSDKKQLYSVGEVDNFEGTKSGFVNAYAVSKSGMLNFINNVSSNGSHPCHIQLNSDNSKVAVSNYTGGTISVHSLSKTGEISQATQVIDHYKRSEQSHAHSAKFFKNNLFVADLGLNTFSQYHFAANDKKYLIKTSYKIENNAGPRHFEISKKGKFIYVINELNSTISVLKQQKDHYVFVQNISTLADGFDGKSFCADIHLSKDGRFLYGSNRGENSIVAFKIHKKSGALQKTQTISTNGDWPRNFTLSPEGNYLLVANQRSKNISVFSVNKNSGNLTFLHSIVSPTPSCLLF